MKKFVTLIVLVLLVVGAWSAGWLWAAGEIRSSVASLGEGDGSAAPKLTCGTFDVTGFPFRFDVTCAAATIIDGDVTTTIAGLKGSVLVYNPTQAVFSALAPVTLADAYSGAQSRIDFAGAQGSASLLNDDMLQGLTGAGWRIGRISVVADGLTWTDTLVGDVLALSAGHAEAHLLDIPEAHHAETGTAALAGFATLTEVAAPGLAVTDGEVSFEAELSGLPDDLRAFADSAAALDRWRNAGGQLKLVSVKGSAGADFVEGSGTLGLDAGARVDGALQLRSRGVVERLGGLLPPELTGLIAGSPADDGSYSQQVNIKAGVVFTGLVPVAMIPPVL